MTCYKISADVDLQPLDNSLIVLLLSKNSYYELNESARFYFEHLSSGEDEASIVRIAKTRYRGVSTERLQADLQAVVHELVSLGVLSPKS